MLGGNYRQFNVPSVTGNTAVTDASTTATQTLDLAPQVLEQALPLFGFDVHTSAELLPVSENVAYRLRPPAGGEVVLRISRPTGHELGVRESELAWLLALRTDADAPVPAVRSSRDGKHVVTVRPVGSELEFQVCIFEAVPGANPSDEEYATLMPQLGAITARFHNHASQWRAPSWFKRPCWDLDAAFGAHPVWGDWRAGVPDRAEREQLERVEAHVRSRLGRFGQADDRFGLIHADLRAANLLVDDGKCRVIDFDDCGFGWHLYDLATALTFMEDHPEADQFIAAWLDGYRSVRDLPSEHEREISTLMLFRRLLTIAFLGNNPGIDVTREMLPGLARGTCDWAEGVLSRSGGVAAATA
jgi:Ser/Thr protein kinase RdoA (MazF antagonist)